VTWRLAAPAIFLAGLLLVPFLDKPFTIDDPLFLHEAKHALVDPLHPADFEQVWNSGDRLKLSQYLLGGTLPAYVLAPVAAWGGREWMAHLYQFLPLCGMIVAGVSVARRLGCDSRQAGSVGLLIAANPVTLAMAATCMPDVMATAFALGAMDRLLAYREGGRALPGVVGAFLFAAAVLCRATTLAILAAGALFGVREFKRKPEGPVPNGDRLSNTPNPKADPQLTECVRDSGWQAKTPANPARRQLFQANHFELLSAIWPLALAALLIVFFGWLTRGESGSLRGAFHTLTALRNVPRNLVGFFCFQSLAGPVLLYALLSRTWKFAAVVAAIGTVGITLSLIFSSPNLTQYAVPAALGLCFILAGAWLLRGVPYALPLGVWLGSGLVALPYVHMAAKYLLPGVPAAALLIVLHAASVRQPRWPLTLALLVAIGWTTGALIITGDATLAGSARAAVQRIIVPRLHRGLNVWAAGQWAFLGYAEDAGARALANTPPFPQPGDFIVVSRLDYYGMLRLLPLHLELLNTEADRRCGVFVLNRRFAAGFYSIRFGYLPFALGCGEVNAYDVYRVLP
jgi:hypothetical protein